MVLDRECQQKTAERFWLAEELREEQDLATNLVYLRPYTIHC